MYHSDHILSPDLSLHSTASYNTYRPISILYEFQIEMAEQSAITAEELLARSGVGLRYKNVMRAGPAIQTAEIDNVTTGDVTSTSPPVKAAKPTKPSSMTPSHSASNKVPPSPPPKPGLGAGGQKSVPLTPPKPNKFAEVGDTPSKSPAKSNSTGSLGVVPPLPPPKPKSAGIAGVVDSTPVSSVAVSEDRAASSSKGASRSGSITFAIGGMFNKMMNGSRAMYVSPFPNCDITDVIITLYEQIGALSNRWIGNTLIVRRHRSDLQNWML